MRTPKQIAASRTNGALSKGPITIQGKLNSSRNSLRHGLLARTVVLEEESTHRFLELLRALVDEFHPSSPSQLMLVETMAVARWRQLRVWGMQKVAMDRAIALQDPAAGPAEVRAVLAFNKSSDSGHPDLLLRYDIALDRQFARALTRLIALQSHPGQQSPAPFHPASLAGLTWKQSPNSESAPEPEPTPPAPAAAKRTQQPVDSSRPPAIPPATQPAPNPAAVNHSQRPSSFDLEPFDLEPFDPLDLTAVFPPEDIAA